MQRNLHHGLLTVVVALVGADAPAVGQTALPTLRIDAPASLEAVAERVGRFPLSHLTTAMTLAADRASVSSSPAYMRRPPSPNIETVGAPPWCKEADRAAGSP